MSSNITAVAAMRALTSRIDQTVEGLIDAHGFALTELKATPGLVQAEFQSRAEDPVQAWCLAMTQSTDGSVRVALNKPATGGPTIALDIRIGETGVATLAEGVALAMSFLAVSEQLAAPSID